MSFVYAMSDIHGFSDPLEKNLKLIDLTNHENKLIFCGDYIDYGKDSCKVLYRIKELTDKYPNQVIAILGNHEYMFLEFLFSENKDLQTFEWLRSDEDFITINSLISSETKTEITAILNQYISDNYFSNYEKCVPIIKRDILTNHTELIKWLKKLPYYYETDTQIFVHAGIDEEAQDDWKWGTSEEFFVSKYPATYGRFYKDIIAGHIGTSTLAKDENFHGIFWDRRSHYFIDGTTNISGIVPLLKYDTDTKKYSSLKSTKSKF